MSDDNLGAEPAGSVVLDGYTDNATVCVDGGERLAKRARVQRNLDQALITAWNAAARARVAVSERGLSQARAAARDATGRARLAAVTRRTAAPTGGTEDSGHTGTAGTLTDQLRAHRLHLLSAGAAAVIAVVMVVVRRRAAAHRADALSEIDVSDLPLNGEPLDD